MGHIADYEQIASAFVAARQNNEVVVSYPGEVPATLESAYAIQDIGISMIDRPVGGWKVGRIPDGLTEKYQSNRLVGPIFADSIVDAGAGEFVMPVLDGFAAAEAELMLRIGKSVPADTAIDDIPDYIDDVRFGIEVASSPFPGINDHGPAVTVSDFGNNFGLVLGPRIDGWQDRDLMMAPVTLSIDGKCVGENRLANMLDGPFGAVATLANVLAARGRELEPGQWVSTGAITGVHQVSVGQHVEASFDGQWRVASLIGGFAQNHVTDDGERS